MPIILDRHKGYRARRTKSIESDLIDSHTGKLVFAQLMEHLPLHTFRQCVAKYPSRYPTLKFSHLDQFLCMAFAQLTYRESLRDIETCCADHRSALSLPLAGRTILQMDQTASQDQAVLRYYENAVKTQIWIAISVYVLVAIVKKQLNTEASLYTILQILSLTLFDKIH